jgi:predicted RNA-binding Zn-ribbon protein involved in translation (DUF1610 family)
MNRRTMAGTSTMRTMKAKMTTDEGMTLVCQKCGFEWRSELYYHEPSGSWRFKRPRCQKCGEKGRYD